MNGLEFAGRAIGRRFDSSRVSHVGGNGDDANTRRLADLGSGALEFLDAAREQNEIDALVSESARDRLPDAFAGTGDERVAAFESEIHSRRDYIS